MKSNLVSPMRSEDQVQNWPIEKWTQYLREQQWIGEQTQVQGPSPLTGGNMNLTLRLNTSEGPLLIKQGRPWVEKYPQIAAPWGRTETEARFYQAVKKVDFVASRMPTLRGVDPLLQVLAMEFLLGISEASSIYTTQEGDSFYSKWSGSLYQYLNHLHAVPLSSEQKDQFKNDALKELNAFHMYDFPLQFDTLRSYEEKFGTSLKWLETNSIRKRLDFQKREYLAPGTSLIHGDFYPGSFLVGEGDERIWVIDPEFCTVGNPDFDFAVLHAHLLLAGASLYTLQIPESETMREKIAFELLRRTLGVAKVISEPTDAAFQRVLQLSGHLLGVELPVR